MDNDIGIFNFLEVIRLSSNKLTFLQKHFFVIF